MHPTLDETDVKSKGVIYGTIALVLFALIVRLALLFHHSPLVPGGDEPEYIALAETFLRTGEFKSSTVIQHFFQGGQPGDPTAYRSPVLPFLLAMHYKVFDYSQTAPRVTLAILSALTCGLLLLLGRLMGFTKAGILAGVLWSVWPPAILGPYAADRFYPETLGVFFLVGHITCVASLRARASSSRALIAGLLLGLAVLTRGYLAILVPIVLLYVATRTKSGIRSALVMGVAATLIIGTWIARNQMVIGKPVLSTQTEHFYLGNNAWARGSFSGDMYLLGTKSPQLMVLEHKYPSLWSMSELERSDMWIREAMLSIRQDPARFAWLLMRKTLVFWAPVQYWQIEYYRWHYAYAIALLFIPFGLYVIYRCDPAALMILLAPILAVYGASLLTYALDRYRFVIEPFILFIAAVGIVACMEFFLSYKQGRLRAPPSTT